jgi:signal transduction histidine kinase
VTWVEPALLADSLMPAHYRPEYQEVLRLLSAHPERYCRLRDLVELVPRRTHATTEHDHCRWTLVKRGRALDVRSGRGADAGETDTLTILPREALLVPTWWEPSFAVHYWNAQFWSRRGGVTVGAYGFYCLRPRARDEIGWLTDQLNSDFCRIQLQRLAEGSLLSRLPSSSLLDVNVAMLEQTEREHLTQRVTADAQRDFAFYLREAESQELGRAIPPPLLTGSTFEERLTQFEEYLTDQQLVEPSHAFFVEASTKDRSSDLFVIRPLRGTGVESDSLGAVRWNPGDDAAAGRQWRQWYWDTSPDTASNVFNSLNSEEGLPTFILARSIGQRLRPETSQFLTACCLPRFEDFRTAVEAARGEDRVDLEQVGTVLADLWLRLHADRRQLQQLSPALSRFGVTGLPEVNVFPLDFTDFMVSWTRAVFRPVLALRVLRGEDVAGAYLLFGEDQLDEPDTVLQQLDALGHRLAAFLSQPAEFAAEAARRESLRRLSGVMHRFNGPVGRAANALSDTAEFLAGHEQLAGQLVPSEEKAQRRAEMSDEPLEGYTLAARLADASKAVSDIRSVVYQIKRLRLAQERPRLASCVISDLMGRLLRESARRVPGLKTECDIPPTLRVLADEERLADAFSEVFSNACRELIEQETAEPQIAVRAVAQGSLLEVSISDNALPRSQDLIEHPFDENASSYARSGRGSGLGLSIVRDTFRSHGGKCSLSVNKDEQGARVRGVTFRCEVRCAPEQEEDKA